MLRTVLKTASVSAAIAVTLASAPSPALAGGYSVRACSPSTSAGSWTPVDTSFGGFTAGNLCGGPEIGPVEGETAGGLYAEDQLNSPVNIPDGAKAGWTFVAPPGTTITAVTYYRHLSTYNNRNIVAGLFQADGTALEQCKLELPLGSSNTCSKPNNQAPVTFTGLSSSSLFVGVICRIVTSALACIAGGEPLHAAKAVMYSSKVTLSESSMPVVSAVAGPMWAGGVVSDVAPVTFSASDPIGIQEQQVRSDTGVVLASAPQACDFSLAQPCPQQPSGSLSVDTRRVPDGPHTFSLVVTDAAGNSQVVTSPPVVVNNYGPPAPSALTATAKGGGSNLIALAWRSPLNPPAPVTSGQVQLCKETLSAGDHRRLERRCTGHGAWTGALHRAAVAARQPGARWSA